MDMHRGCKVGLRRSKRKRKCNSKDSNKKVQKGEVVK